MAGKRSTVNTLLEAHDVKTVWEAIPDFVMGDVTLEQFIAAQNAADTLSKTYSAKENELTGVKIARDNKFSELSSLITRFRSGMRSTYGPDSSEYGRAGGTRASARKRPVRKSATDTTNAGLQS